MSTLKQTSARAVEDTRARPGAAVKAARGVADVDPGMAPATRIFGGRRLVGDYSFWNASAGIRGRGGRVAEDEHEWAR